MQHISGALYVCVSTVVLLGIRKLRACYAEQIDVWVHFWTHSRISGPAPHDIGRESSDPVPLRLKAWAESTGRSETAQMRWQLLPASALVERTRRLFSPIRGFSERSTVALLQDLGAPQKLGDEVSWGVTFPT